MKIGAAFILMLCIAAMAQAPVSIELLDDGAFRVRAWRAPDDEPQDGWASLFRVYAGTGDVPEMAGSYFVKEGSLQFRPRFPLAAGVEYRAVFQPPGRLPIETSFRGPERVRTPSTRVSRIYPSTDVLPENQLKLYIHFTAPMSRGEAWRRIHLLDEHGSPIELPFLEIDQELWDRDNQRLTVLFDPGRIKRGLVPNEDEGPPLRPGKRYALVIDREWQDAGGNPLADGERKQFRVGDSDRVPPDPKRWRLTPPTAGTREPVVVEFGEPMDSGLLEHSFDVAGTHGRLEGLVAIDRGETRWTFTPERRWQSGAYRLVIDRALEDLAGNRIGRPFDVDQFERISRSLTRETLSLPFRVR